MSRICFFHSSSNVFCLRLAFLGTAKEFNKYYEQVNPEAETEQIAGMVGMRRSSRELKKMFVGTNLLHKTLFFGLPFEAIMKRIFRTISTRIQNGPKFSLKLTKFFIKETKNCDTFFCSFMKWRFSNRDGKVQLSEKKGSKNCAGRCLRSE